MNTVTPCVTCDCVHNDFDCIAALKKSLRRTQYLAEQYRDSAERWRLMATGANRLDEFENALQTEMEQCAVVAEKMDRLDIAAAIRARRVV